MRLFGNGSSTQNLETGEQTLEVLQFRAFRRFRNPAEMASIANPLNDKLIKRLDRRLRQVPDQFAIGLSACRRPARHRQAYEQVMSRDKQLPVLQGFDDRLGDRLTLFSRGRFACSSRYQLAIITRPDRLKLQCRDDLARMFPARFVALGVELEHCRVDAHWSATTETTA